MPRLSPLEIIQNKVLDKESLNHQLMRWRFFSQKIVFTNGCFDLVHLGHVDYLAKAAEEGDVLIVGINSDASTSALKGPLRPINDQQQRAMIIASFHFISAVIIFDEPTPYELIRKIQPDVLVKGSDYKPEDIAGYDIVTSKKGIVKTIDLVPGYSTTSIEEKIRSFVKQ